MLGMSPRSAVLHARWSTLFFSAIAVAVAMALVKPGVLGLFVPAFILVLLIALMLARRRWHCDAGSILHPASALCVILLLAACSAVPLPTADPAEVAKVNYICAYSGEFQLINGGLGLIPVPGIGAATTAIGMAARDACANPERTAQLVDGGKQLIANFKALGKM